MLRLPAVSRAVSHAPALGAPAPPSRRLAPPRRGAAPRASASGGESPEAFPETMSLADAYSLLGLKEDTGYEQVLDKKNALLAK